MKTALLVSVVSATSVEQDQHPVREEIVQQIQQSATSWQAKPIEENYLKNIPKNQLSQRLGYLGASSAHSQNKMFKQLVQGASDKSQNILNYITESLGIDKTDKQSSDHHFKLGGDKDIVRPKKDDHYSEEQEKQSDQPWQWDWRAEMQTCIGEIEDQGECGACWAFSSSGMLSDRFCIQTGGAITTRLSPQELVDCNYQNFGCEGGYLIPSIEHLLSEGLVSNECMPYTQTHKTCQYSCVSPYQKYEKFFCDTNSLTIKTDRESIKKEIVENGPMMMGLEIYEDFMNYHKGVYQHVTGEFMGGHAMKVIGYGHHEKEGLFWILQNQWTQDWGDQGYIYIKHGQIGIDDLALSCMPDLL